MPTKLQSLSTTTGKNMNADLTIIKNAIKQVESKVYRDYMELENLQNSNAILKFSSMTLKAVEQQIFDYLVKNRPEYNIITKNGQNHKVEKSNSFIYVNCISGLKNFVHSIPYFATIIGIKKDDKYTTAVINNYATQEMFVADINSGAFLNDKRIRVSNKTDQKNLMISIKYDASREKFMKILNKIDLTFKVNNCSILDVCSCACGKLDGGIILESNRNELEIAELFVIEAGGLFNYINQDKTNCYFSNSLIHNKIKDLLND